jgi:hypothetical protein
MLYLNLAYIYVKKAETANALRFAARSLAAWPPNRRLYEALIRFAIRSFAPRLGGPAAEERVAPIR